MQKRQSTNYGATLPVSSPGSEKDIAFTVIEPLGVIVCVTPFNYPIELYAQKVAPALAGGNTVIVKPAQSNPLAIGRLVELALESGLPSDAIQFITGSGAKVGQWLSEHPGIDAISLTGSTGVGIKIMQAASSNLTRVFLELGGNDANIILDDADLDLAVEEITATRLQNTGQTCCAPKRLLVQKSINELCLKKLIDRISKINIGDPQDEKTDLSCLINSTAVDSVVRDVDLTIKQGATLVYGGTRRDSTYYVPAILDDVTPEMDIARDMEVFGPVFPVISFDTDEDALEIANASQFGLMGAVFSNNAQRAMTIASKMECGGVVFNGVSTYRTLDMPFGGYKKSGIGREGVLFTLEEMTQMKTIIMKSILK
ncbi:aldehyde dehydrogenase [Oceanispirochaeta sp.]|jgi:acyl-CoA reductase-like NAD-dependent aldehyde dehydrogenase|uniref:aldehyde dehydrogenase family protein n=1 Tax=Oceanispirochaeta sp. TaxID=2035350 RepID=UPI00262BE9C1|nr:aldehyde dehydrogenase family protein [Oceanispirochaeta sp.]MDA3955797.1 aldehyde dehydrogenase family protein [Oceanispirochaeta sp.]